MNKAENHKGGEWVLPDPSGEYEPHERADTDEPLTELERRRSFVITDELDQWLGDLALQAGRAQAPVGFEGHALGDMEPVLDWLQTPDGIKAFTAKLDSIDVTPERLAQLPSAPYF